VRFGKPEIQVSSRAGRRVATEVGRLADRGVQPRKHLCPVSFGCGNLQRSLPEEDHALQAFLLRRSHEALEIRIQIWRARRQLYGPYTGLLQDGSERVGEFRVAIHQQIILPAQESVFGVAQIPGGLTHPQFVMIRGASGEVHAPRGQFHDEEQITGNQAASGPDLDRGEVD